MEGRPTTDAGRAPVKRRMDTETGRSILTRMQPTKSTKLKPNTTKLTQNGQDTDPTNRKTQRQRAATALTKEPKQKEGDHKRERQQTNTSDGRQTEDRHTHQKGETRTKTKGSNKGDKQPQRRRTHATEERPRDHPTTMGDLPISTQTQEATKAGNKPKTN